jgi:hypothetical protein
MAKLTEISLTPSPVVTLEQAKAFLRVDHTQDDQLITDLIAQASQEAESYTGLIFGDAVYTYEDYGGGRVFISWPAPVTSINTVQSEGTDLEYRDNLDGSLTIYDVPTDKTFVVNFNCGMVTVKADVQEAVLQRIKFGYDYGDDLPYDKARFFDHVLFRYRRIFTS